MSIEKILNRLYKCGSVSGYETEMAKAVADMMSPFCESTEINRFNSVVCRKKGNGGKKLVFEAHLDQIGLIVTEIDSRGFVRFMNVGGVDKRILPGSEVVIMGSEKVYGIIGAKPPHLKEDSESGKMPEIGDMLIDTGYSAEELKKRISVGNSIVFDAPLIKLQNKAVCAPALDNRAGMASLINSAEKISKTDSVKDDIYFVFTSREETGLQGICPTVREIMPDYAVVVDVTHGTTIDSKKDVGTFPLGCGPVICTGPGLCKTFGDRIMKIADEKEIGFETEVVSGNSGTNAWGISQTGIECAAALISIPLKYMHTSVETVKISDISAVSDLLESIAKEGVADA